MNATPASAHLVSSGLGPFYDGTLHFFYSPVAVAAVIGLILFSGLRGTEHTRWTLFMVSGACFVGDWAGGVMPLRALSLLMTSGACVVLGILAAVDLKAPLGWTVAFAWGVGLLAGAMDDSSARGPGGLLGVLGMGAAVFVMTALLGSTIVSVRVPWARIAVRVAGSWVAAIGLLLVGLVIRSSK